MVRRRRRPTGVSSNKVGAVTLRVMMVAVDASMPPTATPARERIPAAVAELPSKLGHLGAGYVASSHCTIKRLSVSGVPSSSTRLGTRVAALAWRKRESSAHGSTMVGSTFKPFSIIAIRAMRTKGEVVLARSCIKNPAAV